MFGLLPPGSKPGYTHVRVAKANSSRPEIGTGGMAAEGAAQSLQHSASQGSDPVSRFNADGHNVARSSPGSRAAGQREVETSLVAEVAGKSNETHLDQFVDS